MDVPAAYGLGALPFWLVVATLVGIVLARSHGTYWLARGAVSGAARLGAARASDVDAPVGPVRRRVRAVQARVLRWAASTAGRRSLATLHRIGPAAVTLAYLTVGAQTAVFAAAGLSRMSYVRFTVASLPGSVAWAVVWATVGLSALWGAVGLAARSPWALAAAVAAVGIVGFVLVRRRREPGRAAARSATSRPGAVLLVDAQVDDAQVVDAQVVDASTEESRHEESHRP